MSALPWLIGGVCAGLLGVCVLAVILFGVGNNKPAADAGNAELRAGNSSVAAGKNDGRRRRQGDRTRSRLDEALARREAAREQIAPGQIVPGAERPDHLTWDHDPDIETGGDILRVDDLDDPSSAAGASTDAASARDANATASVEDATAPSEPVARLGSLPRAVALPSRKMLADAAEEANAELAPAVLTRIDVDDPQQVQLEIVAHPLAGGSGRFELAPADDAASSAARAWNVRHVADGTPPTEVGQYRLADGELSFEWSPAAQEDERYAQLENYPLQITAGEETATIAQRVAEELSPITVKVDAGAVRANVPIDNPPENAELMVSVDDLSEEFGEHAWDPADAIEVGKTTHLRFGSEADPFQLALRITAEQAGPNQVRIETRPMFREGNSRKWDYFRPEKAAQTLAALEQQQAAMDAQYQQIQRRFRNNEAARQQAAALHNRRSAALLESIAALQRIDERCQALQDKAQLHFRLYARTGDEEIDLARTTKSETTSAPDEASADAPAQDESTEPSEDPNVGPPVSEPSEPVGEGNP